MGREHSVILRLPVTAAILDEEMHRGLEKVRSDPKGEDDWLKDGREGRGGEMF